MKITLLAPKDIPDEPTHCQGRGCGVLLEPLRRYAGLCKACVVKCSRRLAKKRPKPKLRILRSFMRHGEKHVEVECVCGNRRIMRLSTLRIERPTRCKRCRLREAADLRSVVRARHERRKEKNA